jgi:hypothetical protein
MPLITTNSLRFMIKTNFEFDAMHFRCFAHVLNLSVQAALSSLNKSICNLRNGIKAIRVSPLKLTKLKSFCDLEEDLKCVKQILDVPTQWNSTYDMLFCALNLKNPLNIMLNEMNQNKKVMNLEESNWNIFKDIVEFLRPFKETCEASCCDTCCDKYPSLGVVVPLYNSLIDRS